MRDVIVPAAVMLAALAVVGISVRAGNDRTVLVSPPASVAEQFVRKLATGRYAAARDHLLDESPEMRERVRAASQALRARAGAVSQVKGNPGTIDGNLATATAVVTSERAGEITMMFTLVRRAGSWRISEF